MTDTDVQDQDYQRLARFRRELRQFLRFSETAARRAGLTPRHYQALLAIRARADDGMLIGELADEMLLKPHSATGLVDRLVDAGLAERVRDDDDRRQVRVRATAAARAMLVSLAATHRTELRRLKPMLTDLLGSL